ncbi:hypothetical protein [Bacillus sp. NPDC094106]|uniref:hypothetical protein n=1 Tax=Bacillus sp. NPDC094106 TaxID=3363949 RepID=UPI00382FA30E
MRISLLLRYFTFWFLIISLVICTHEYMGGDNKHLLFFSFGLDPIMTKAVYTEPYRSMMFDESSSKILYFGYVLHISLAFLYGLCLDLIKFGFKKVKVYL